MTDAELAIATMRAEDAYQALCTAQRDPVTEVALPGPLGMAWTLRGHITGVDTLLRRRMALSLKPETVWYGWVLQSRESPSESVAAIRGTISLEEWIEDAEFITRTSPRAGRVEDGFFGLYQSLRWRSLTGASAPLVASLSAVTGSGRLTLAGHSLGAALALFAALDLAAPGPLGHHVCLRTFGCPRPGDSLFAQYAGGVLSDAIAYKRQEDRVPDLPPFNAPPTFTRIIPSGKGPQIHDSLTCAHHVVYYGLDIDPTVIALDEIPAQYRGCLIDAPEGLAI